MGFGVTEHQFAVAAGALLGFNSVAFSVAVYMTIKEMIER